MADPNAIDGDLMTSVATHGVGAIGSGSLGAWLMNLFRSKSEREVATQLALLRNDMDRVLKVIEKHDAIAERVALLEASVKAVHARLDGKRGKR